MAGLIARSKRERSRKHSRGNSRAAPTRMRRNRSWPEKGHRARVRLALGKPSTMLFWMIGESGRARAQCRRWRWRWRGGRCQMSASSTPPSRPAHGPNGRDGGGPSYGSLATESAIAPPRRAALCRALTTRATNAARPPARPPAATTSRSISSGLACLPSRSRPTKTPSRACWGLATARASGGGRASCC